MEIGKEYYLELGELLPVHTKIVEIDDDYVYVEYPDTWFDHEEKFKIDEFKWLIGKDDEKSN